MPLLATLNKNSARIYPMMQALNPTLSHHNALYFILFVHDLFQRRIVLGLLASIGNQV
jgi:hypothetical protein